MNELSHKNRIQRTRKKERNIQYIFETTMRPSVLGKWRKTRVISDREAGKSL